MAQEDRNRLVEWYEILRRQGPVVRRRVEDWVEAVREEPRLIWATPVIRYASYVFCGLGLVWGAAWFASSIAPPPPASAKPRSTTADFHLICSHPACGHHFVIHRELGFRKFPVMCPRCEDMTGRKALRCNSETCRGRWSAPDEAEGVSICQYCGEPLP